MTTLRLRATPAVTPADRLGLTLFLAAVLHAIVILGVTFAHPRAKTPSGLTTLSITLVQKRSLHAPAHADFLAQANLDGGGNSPRKVLPHSPLSALTDIPQQGVAPAPSPPAAPQRSAPAHTQVLTSPRSRTPVESKTDAPPAPEPTLAAPQHLSPNLDIARLSTEVKRFLEQDAHRPRQTFIDARTRAFKYAAYMHDWVLKVERVGNLNYPEEARRRHLSGSLLLDVALNADGSIHSITLLRSSGHRVLDQAAQKIVELAAPFAPFPPDIRKDTDVLHIVRTWEFLSSNQLASQ